MRARATAGTVGALLLGLGIRAAADEGYYQFNGRELAHVAHGRPEEVLAKEWQFWLYRKGAAAAGPLYWGVIAGRSVAAVRAELKSSQDFERAWERWCGCPWGDDTNFNPLGPIAVVEAPLYPRVNRAADLAERIIALRKIVQGVSAITEGRPANPFRAVGTVLREYVWNLKDAQGKLRRLRRMMNDIALPPMEATFTELEGIIARSESSAPAVRRAIDTAYQPGGSRPAGAWTSSSYRAPDDTQITQAIECDGTAVRVTLTVVGTGAPATRTYSFDARSLAVDRVRIRQGGPTGWLVTVTALGRSITDVSTSPEQAMTAHTSTVDLTFPSEDSARAAVEALVSLARSRSAQP